MRRWRVRIDGQFVILGLNYNYLVKKTEADDWNFYLDAEYKYYISYIYIYNFLNFFLNIKTKLM